ncbi:MAG: hypothetical protein LH629_14590 [Ignavibacteria bacterium]|nr:hypothetical protein [Ignavibacteria bacterium]
MLSKYLFLIILLFSCSYNNGQKEIINKISIDNPEVYSNSFEKIILKEFNVKELENLTNDKNPKTRIYFYNYLIKNHPKSCFDICLNHLKDSSRLLTSTSYDTQEYLSVSELMITKARDKNIFSTQENEILDSMIITNINNYNHLASQFYLYLHKNATTPKVEFYNSIRNLVRLNNQSYYFQQISLINYFSNYNIKTDNILIENYLAASLKKDSTIYFNSALEFIRNNPRANYFHILTDFYKQNILNKTTRSDECFFELKLFCEALSKFPNAETNSILNNLINSNQYISQCNYLAKNEQFYYLLKQTNNSYYQTILKSLEHKIDKDILTAVEKSDN